MWDLNFKLKRYYHKFKLNRIVSKGLVVQQGHYGIRLLKSGFLYLSEVKSIHLLVRKTLKKSGKIWFNINPNLILTKKPIESRMGKGKGGVTEYVAVVPMGLILLEIESSSTIKTLNLMQKIISKLHLPAKLIKFKL
jgi:large subunit ribosomal protein L16